VTASGVAPLPDELSEAYWDAAAEGRLLIQRCLSCGQYQFYPRRHCAHCFGPDPVWHRACGRGRVHTYTVVRQTPNAEFRADCPYVLAIIELDEGPRLTGRIVGASPGEVACDASVQVVFSAGPQNLMLPNFSLTGT
jgi:uncharacterized OB-fold protein